MKYFIYEDGGTVESEAVLQGMSLTGFLKINKDPFVSNEAVNKEYVDGLSKELPSGGVTTGIMSERRFPDMEGELTSNAGSGLISLSDTGVLVGTYPKVSVNRGGTVVGGENLQAVDIPSLSWGKLGTGSIPDTLSGYGITNAVNKNTGTILGTLRNTVHPLLPNDAVTKTYIDNKISTVVGYSTGDVITGEWDTVPEGFLQCNGGEVDKDMYPVLYSILGDKYGVNSNELGNGEPWRNHHTLSQTSALSGPWRRDSLSYVENFTFSDSPNFVAKGHLCIFSSIDPECTSLCTFKVNKVGNDTILGTMKIKKLGQHISSSASNVVYTGGRYYSVYLDKMYSFVIDDSGNISGKIKLETSIPGVTFGRMVVIGNKLYVLDINNAVNGVFIYFNLNKDGVPNTKDYVVTLIKTPMNGRRLEMLVIKNKLHLLGGSMDTVPTTYTANHFTMDISSEGLTGGWTRKTVLDVKMDLGSAICIGNKVYLIGGNRDSMLTVTSFDINVNGDLVNKATHPYSMPPDAPDIGWFHGYSAIVGNRVFYPGRRSANTGEVAIASCPITNLWVEDYDELLLDRKQQLSKPLKFNLPDAETPSTKYYIKY